MSWKIQITKAKPNPLGKDTSHGRPLPAQLLGEWVDLKNVGDAPVATSILYLSNTEFGVGCVVRQATKNYWNGPLNGSIKPGEIARIHTGRSGDAWQMQPMDKEGVTYHLCHKKLAYNNYGRAGRRGAWEIEHSVPRARGGADHLNNLKPACIGCNRNKGIQMSRTARGWNGKTRPPMPLHKRRQAKLENGIIGAFCGGVLG